MSDRDLKKVRKFWNTRTLSKLLFSVNHGIFSTTLRDLKRRPRVKPIQRRVAMATSRFLIKIMFPNQCDTKITTAHHNSELNSKNVASLNIGLGSFTACSGIFN